MNMNSDIKIWRYMDLAKYVGLLSRGLFFARASEFYDEWEGSWPLGDVADFRQQNQNLLREEITPKWQDHYESKRISLNNYGISSWHRSQRESAALWSLYIARGLGVAIQSTVLDLLSALTADGREIRACGIKYIDYKDQRLGDDPLTLLSHKRSEFEYEREIRFIVTLRLDEIDAVNAMDLAMRDHLDKRQVRAGIEKPLIRTFGGYTTTDNTLTRRTSPSGVHLETNAQKLIQRIYLAPKIPYHIRRAVIDVTKAFGLSTKLITESQMDQVPFDHLEFND